MELIIVVDDEAARLRSRRLALGKEVVAELFGSDARVSTDAQDQVAQLGKIVESLGLGSVYYEKGTQQVDTN